MDASASQGAEAHCARMQSKDEASSDWLQDVQAHVDRHLSSEARFKSQGEGCFISTADAHTARSVSAPRRRKVHALRPELCIKASVAKEHAAQ